MLKAPTLPFWNVAISNTRMHLFLTLYSLAEIRFVLSSPVRRMGWATGELWGWWGHDSEIPSTAETVATLTAGTAALSPPGDGEGRLFCEPHNGPFTAEREGLWRDTMGSFREVVLLLLGPALGLCSQRTFIRLLLSLIPWRSVCRRPQGRLWE